MGRHPFSGRFLGTGEMPLEMAITEGRFAYGPGAAARLMRQPPGTPPLEVASGLAVELFERAFARRAGTRPRPAEWVTALTGLGQSLRPCPKNAAHHVAAGHLPSCPWCEVERQSGARLFNAVVATVLRSTPTFDVAAVWAKIVAVPSPGPAPAPAAFAPSGVAPSPEAVSRGRVRRARVWSAWGVAFVSISAGFSSHVAGMPFWAVALVLVAAAVAGAGGKDRDETAKRLRQTEDRLRSVEQRWAREAGPEPFEARLREMKAKKEQYADLVALRQRRLGELTTDRRKYQLQKYLDGFKIARADLPGIGPSRTATLVSYGIETAADVDERKVLAIPGFGPTNAAKLTGWRRSLEKRFVFDPNKGTDPADVAAIESDIATRRARLEDELRKGASTLENLRKEILSRRETLRPALQAAAKAAALARADLGAM
jgi:DNA-binding helix-hairpin-helix protein with protein kinase domain